MLNFKVVAYNHKEVKDKKRSFEYLLHDGITLYLDAKSEAEALRKARAITKKRSYQVMEVKEHSHTDPWANFPFEKLKKLLK